MKEHPCAVCEKKIPANAQCFWGPHTQLAFCSPICAAAPKMVSCPKCLAEREQTCVGRSFHPERIEATKKYVEKIMATPFEELLERSSLGTPETKALRDSVPKEVIDKVLARADELSNANVRHLRSRKP